MTTDVIFYVLHPGQTSEEKACSLLLERLHGRERVAVKSASKQKAEEFDELLWALPAEHFIPHSLIGEGAVGGAPVVIGWDQPLTDYGYQRQLLVNLQSKVPDFAHQFRTIIDFVPADAEGKEEARERYREYRRYGCTLATQQPQESKED